MQDTNEAHKSPVWTTKFKNQLNGNLLLTEDGVGSTQSHAKQALLSEKKSLTS